MKQDNDFLIEMGMSQKFIGTLYIGCKKILNKKMEDYYNHIKNLEERMLEKILYKWNLILLIFSKIFDINEV